MSLHGCLLNINYIAARILIRRVFEFLLVELVRIIVVWMSLIVIDLVVAGEH